MGCSPRATGTGSVYVPLKPMPATPRLTPQERFNAAMALYNGRRRYRVFETLVATANVSLQLVLVVRIIQQPGTLLAHAVAFLVAYVLADFLSGIVHLLMDGNQAYESACGPLIANFHLHHKVPRYTRRPLWLVYFKESGSKVWLAPFLLAVVLLQGHVPSTLWLVLVYTGILSTVAEVSHYLCHTSNSRTTKVMGSMGLLLSKRHHDPHHRLDNTRYAFLNGMTDGVVDWIARRWFAGYKHGTDLDYAQYRSPSGEDR
jgi:hypothetical protein